MKISEIERETLTGPAAVGVAVGIFAALCTVAFNSDYGGAALPECRKVGGVMLSFFAGFLLAFVPFGVAPVLLARFTSRTSNKTL